MLGQLGTGLVALGFSASLYATAASLVALRPPANGRAQRARRATSVAAAALWGAVALLAGALLADRFDLAYVAAHSSRALPTWLKVSAVWGGQEGSHLLWAALQAGLVVLVARGTRGLPASGQRWACAILSLIAAFFSGVTLFASSPFLPSSVMPPDGTGLDPLLRHPAMAFHPPALYLGYVSLAAPYALALASLGSDQGVAWSAAIRRWTLWAWCFLGIGLLLGARWAYDVLGWGGYWGWDPIENAGLLPWLTATALLHGGRASGDGRRAPSGWTVLLATLCFVLVLFGAYATRSGAIQSVHAYARSGLGGVYLGAMAAAALVSLLAWRLRGRRAARPTPAPQPGWPDALLSLTRLLLLLLTGSILVGSLLPTLTEALGGLRFEAGPDWFDAVTGPQFAALILAMGLCPLADRAADASGAAARRRGYVVAAALGGALAGTLALCWAGLDTPASLGSAAIIGLALGATLTDVAGEPPRPAGRAARRYGALAAHLGVALMALGVIGTRAQPLEAYVTLALGEPREVMGYSLVYEGTTRDVLADRAIERATVSVYRQDALLAKLRPEIHLYANGEGAGTVVSVPAVRSTFQEDVYLVLTGLDAGVGQASFLLMRNRLVALLWAGGMLLLGGGALAAWPTTIRADVPECPPPAPTASPARLTPWRSTERGTQRRARWAQPRRKTP